MSPPPKKIFGLIGYPVKHSLSAAMHNAAFGALKIAAEYQLFEVPPGELDIFMRSIAQKNIYGLNVTVPHKEKVIPFLDFLEPEARLIGAVNTIKLKNKRLEGCNTDGRGFLRHLSWDLHFESRHKTIAVIGAGGAAKAVCVYLAKSEAKKIAIYDTDKIKKEGLINHLQANFKHTLFSGADSTEGLDILHADMLINATPVGMKADDPLLVDEKLLHKRLLVYDLIYNPRETKLLKSAKEKGAQAACGLGMLLYQGALSFEYFTGEKAPLQIMRQALEGGAR